MKVERLEITKDEFTEVLKDLAFLGVDAWKRLKDKGFVKEKDFGDLEDSYEGLFMHLWLLTRVKYKKGTPKAFAKKSIEKLTIEALAFSREVEMAPREGFIKFLDILVGTFDVSSLYKMGFEAEKVQAYYDMEQKVNQDPNPRLTAKLIELYRHERLLRFNEVWHPKSMKDRVPFVNLAEKLKIARILPEEYMVDIFDRFDWLGKPFYLASLEKGLEGNAEVIKPKRKVVKVKLKEGAERW